MNSSSIPNRPDSGDSTALKGAASASVSASAVSSTLVAINVLRDAINQNVEAQYMVVFLTIAGRSSSNPMNVLEVSRVAGVAEASASRIVTALGRGWKDKPGCGLLETREDPTNYSRKLIYLTPKGLRLIERLTEALGANHV